MASYFDMGGYADFIWPAYVIVVIVMVWLIVATRIDLVRQRKLLSALEGDKGARKRAPARISGSDR
ncbi:MAG: heme exporter protein CcmD [Parvibaculum sp.]